MAYPQASVVDNREAQARPALLEVSLGGHSLAGVKPRNDDAFAAFVPESEPARRMKGAVACIADGISASQKSQIASQLSVTQFIDDYFATPDSWSVEKCASKVLRALNDWLSAQGGQGQAEAMVTTFSAAVLKSHTLHVFHVGDSRVYRLRDGQLDQLTRDHAVNDTLTSALGMDPRLVVDYSQHEARIGDVILLTTDGVSDVLSHRALTEHLGLSLRSEKTVEAAAQTLCDMTLRAGSKDNITCGILQVDNLAHESVDDAFARVQRRIIPPVMKPGNTIDHYEILSLVHSGTRSHVYRAKCLNTDATVILKAASQNFAHDAVYLDGFVREEWVGRRLSHVGLMKVFPAPPESSFLYLVCEDIRGISLRDWMTENAAPSLAEVREILGDLVPALRALHRMGMVHRDIKPENIMISHHGEVKVIDYGTVQVAGLDEIDTVIVEDHAVGSVNYSAPELVLGTRATPQSDLFALGVIAFEMLSGKRPFADYTSAMKRPSRLDDWVFEPLKPIRPDLPNWACYAIERACAPHPDQRYPAMSEFVHDLGQPGTWARQKEAATPLLERNPVAFWRGLGLILLILNIILLVLLFQRVPQ